MDITIPIDRDMAHVILGAFSVASFEGMSSLIENNHAIEGRPEGGEYAAAELRVLKVLTKIYPDVAKQYFDLNRQARP
jgi:hypothetical protein